MAYLVKLCCCASANCCVALRCVWLRSAASEGGVLLRTIGLRRAAVWGLMKRVAS